jgi:transketolase
LLEAITKNRPLCQPLAVIADTVKGYGSAVTENKAEWHHKVPGDIEYEKIKADLKKRRDSCG